MSTFVYVEGGGSSKDLRTRCRQAFHAFIAKAVGAQPKPRIVACGSRAHAFDDFKTRLRTMSPGDSCVLLVDSEDVVAPDRRKWEHVRRRPGDGWEQPAGAAEDQLHFMAVCMESWLAADGASLARLFGPGFRQAALPVRSDLEALEKSDLFAALSSATRDSSKGEYRKGKLSFEALAAIDPDRVAQRMPRCADFIRKLKGD